VVIGLNAMYCLHFHIAVQLRRVEGNPLSGYVPLTSYELILIKVTDKIKLSGSSPAD
jgi:hypothetical protein